MSLADLLHPQNEENPTSTGVSVGIVTSNKDEEGLGRVKVNLSWRGERDESYWARIAVPMAGNGRGIVFYPEVGDEVLVAFEQGDINHPYVLGALWNGKDVPPETNSDGKNNIRKIKSRSGHELIFNDEEKKEKIEIHTKAGHRIILDDTSGKEKMEISDKNGNNSILIDSAKNSIAISSQMELSIKAQTIEIESGGAMTIKAGGTMIIDSSATLTIKGSLVKIN